MSYQNIHSTVRPLIRSDVQPGGICWIKFAKIEEVLTWPTIQPLTGICNSAIALKSGALWYDVYMPDTDRLFNESQEDSDAGSFWNMSLSGYVAGNQAANVLSAGTMPYHDYFILFQDRDGLTRMIGDEDSGASFKNSYSSGEHSASRKRIISFAWQSPNPAPIYSGASILPPFGGAYISLDIVQFPIVLTYAAMLVIALGDHYKRIKVLHDEDKGMDNTTYDYWPGFGLDWVAVTKN